MTRSSLISFVLAACVPALVPVAPAWAARLRISPIGVHLTATERAGAITIVNTDDRPVNLQLRIYEWSEREDGQEQLDRTDDMIVSPPAITVPAGASYTIRVARPMIAPVNGELAYRLLIDELPQPDDPRTTGQGVKMVLRNSLPVFVTDAKAMAELKWAVWQDEAGVHVRAENQGKRHAKIVNLMLQTPSGHPLSFGGGLNGYVLGGATRVFTLPVDAPGAGARLRDGDSVSLVAKNDALDVKAAIVVGRR
ncbi:molecular chaperone [Sphingomonas koreensis]|uniref:fimbrial biogenesis chaperone n=1 Tax=Sphingomonas koreensis TaxID=93064 RepID=UPI00082EC1DC|nr:molecular chaperone [Sphingomonas koreensis]PJI89297.1 fimbrial chaperone protein [Sphingomonas koreensis]RSU59793.1 molecular chaperone [Sphingomonas koreensis]RSU70814.1 molecular chaperone [Sphingomonas koreensis]